MYLEHFDLHQAPFKEEPDIHIFYPGGQREAVCQALISDVIVGKPLIKFIGEEGAGKTLICRVLAEQVPTDYDVVYIDNPIGSYDDLLRVICLDLGMHPSGGHESVNFVHELHGQLDRRRQENRKVLIIVDEAEKLFLATLERLVRSVCEAGEVDVLRIVLAGRPGLDANLEQLAIYCANVDINAGHYLEPLSAEETRDYLMYRLEAAGLAQDQVVDFFSEGAVAKIHASAKGNMRMINILAEESLQNSFSVKSFMVLLDHVSVEENPEERPVGSLPSLIREKANAAIRVFQENRLLAGAGGAALVLIILIGLLVSGGEEPATVIDRSQPTTAEEAVKVPSPVEKVEMVIEEEASPPLPVTEEQPQLESETPPSAPASTEVAEVYPLEEEDPLEEVIEEPLDTPAEVAEQPATADISPPVPSVIREQEKTPIEQPTVVIVGPERKKRAPGAPAEVETAPSSEKAVSPPPALEKKPEKIIVKGRDGELLFRERRRASAGWLAEAFRGGYTIQLMMLTSNQAEENLKRMLVQDQYYAIRDNLYILRKKTTPPTLFVYYGIYESMDHARQERNTMPVFLRKHHPYALSISDALKKSES